MRTTACETLRLTTPRGGLLGQQATIDLQVSLGELVDLCADAVTASSKSGGLKLDPGHALTAPADPTAGTPVYERAVLRPPMPGPDVVWRPPSHVSRR